MSFRNTAALLFLFLALGAYLWFVESEKMREEAKEKELFPGLELEDVSGVTLEYPDRSIVLRKTGAGWRIQEPKDLRADQTAVENLVRAVVDLEVTRTLEDPASPETYGLAEPKVVVVLERRDASAPARVRVGKNAPVGYSTFLQREGEKTVRLVASSFATGMEKEVDDLRDKEILAFETGNVRRITVEGGDVERFVLARGDDDGWKIEEPEPRAADDAEVGTYLSSLGALRAQSFFDEPEDLSRFGLDEPRRRITFSIEGREDDAVLLVGGEGEDDDGQKNLYVTKSDSGTVYGVGTYARANLEKSASAFRDKRLFAFGKDEVGAVEITRADGEAIRIERVRADEGAEDGKDRWLVAGDEDTTSEGVTRQLVGDVHALRGFEIAAEEPDDLSPFGLVSPDLTFSLLDGEGKALGRALVSRAGEGEDRASYAMREGGDAVFRIRDYLYSHLDKKRVDLVEAEPAPEAKPGEEDADDEGKVDAGDAEDDAARESAAEVGTGAEGEAADDGGADPGAGSAAGAAAGS